MCKFEFLVMPEVEEFLADFPFVLVKEEYKSSFEYANEMLDEVVDFIYQLPYVPHYQINPNIAYHFNRYGENLEYAFFKRKSSHRTTWYVFFYGRGKQIHR